MWSWTPPLTPDTVITTDTGQTNTLSQIITATNGGAVEWWVEHAREVDGPSTVDT